jgi:hypothetical protein
MTPKEKAEDLFSVFCIYPLTKEYGQYLSLKAVDEIIELAYWEYMESMSGKEEEYWKQVKQEINNL